jgi:hypothetical protein
MIQKYYRTYREMQKRANAVEDKARGDFIRSSLPFGDLFQGVHDLRRYGSNTAIERGVYAAHHPYHFAAPIAGGLAGLLSGALLKNFRSMRKLYSPVNKLLLGNGPHRYAPEVGIGLTNSILGGFVGANLGRGVASREYTMREKLSSFLGGDSSKPFKESDIMLASSLATISPSLASLVYAHKAPLYRESQAVQNAIGSKDWGGVNNTMDDYVKSRGVVYANRAAGNAPTSRQGLLMQQLSSTPGAYMDVDSNLSKTLALNVLPANEVRQTKGLIFGSKNEAPILNRLLGLSQQDTPALHVTAHEMGHHLQPSWMKNMGARLGLKGPMLGAAAPIISSDENIALAGAGAGTALAVPGIIGEFDASRRGTNLLKQVSGDDAWKRMGWKGRMSPYIGVPTYLAALAAPWLAYGTRKSMGGFDQDKPDLRDTLSRYITR